MVSRQRKIDAIIVTHEHSDHVRGFPTLVKKFNIPVYTNEKTRKRSKDLLAPIATSEFVNGESFEIGDLEIEPFSVSHDAADPVAFNIKAEGSKLSYLSDLGQVTELVREKVRGLDALILESNHDPDLLLEAPYPWELKQRIKSRTGHLSNLEAGELVEELASNGERIQIIVAAHISENSNLPELAVNGLKSAWKRAKLRAEQIEPVFVAGSVSHATDLFVLKNSIYPSELKIPMDIRKSRKRFSST